MPRDLQSCLAYEATRRPDIAALVARVADLSDAEIDAAALPMPWYRTALRELRAHRRAADANCRAVLHADDMNRPDTAPEAAKGMIHAWTGGDCWLPMGQKPAFGMRSGMLLWLPDAGGLWVEQAFSALVDPLVSHASQVTGRGTYHDYLEQVRQRENREAPVDPPGLVHHGTHLGPTTRLAALGVRFGR